MNRPKPEKRCLKIGADNRMQIFIPPTNTVPHYRTTKCDSGTYKRTDIIGFIIHFVLALWERRSSSLGYATVPSSWRWLISLPGSCFGSFCLQSTWTFFPSLTRNELLYRTNFHPFSIQFFTSFTPRFQHWAKPQIGTSWWCGHC